MVIFTITHSILGSSSKSWGTSPLAAQMRVVELNSSQWTCYGFFLFFMWSLFHPTRYWPRQGSWPPLLLHCHSVVTLSTVTVSYYGCEGWIERMTWRRALHPNTSLEDTSGPFLRRSFSVNLHSSPDTPMRWGCLKGRELHSGTHCFNWET